MPDVTSERLCAACGAANRADRELCVRCGADLDGGGALPRPVTEPTRADAVREPGAREPERRRFGWFATLLALLVAAVLIVGGVSLAGFGPFAPQAAVPEATFDEEVYADDPVPLGLSGIATRTTQDAAGDEANDASRMVDDDPQTSWWSGSEVAEDEQSPETVDLVLTDPAWVTRLVVRNGDHLDPDAYADRARLRQVQLRFDGGVVVPVDLQDLGLVEQEIVLPEPLLTTAIHLEVVEVFAGAETDELAISDLRVEGHPTTTEDADLAERRAEARPAEESSTSLGWQRRS